mgnify:CR=1 FL=1
MTEILQKPESSIEVAEYLLLEAADPMLQAAIAISWGCDALPGGIPGVSVGTISKKIFGHSLMADTLLIYIPPWARKAKRSIKPWHVRSFGNLQT